MKYALSQSVTWESPYCQIIIVETVVIIQQYSFKKVDIKIIIDFKTMNLF